MKIRIKGDSIRLRLTQTEVKDLNATGNVEDAVHFSPNAKLTYRVMRSTSGDISCSFTNDCISLSIPSNELNAWANSEQVSIESESQIDDGRVLRILLEKDFACLTVRQHEDESDMFPNPNLSC